MPPRQPLLAQDPMADVETHRVDSRFVPVRAGDLVDAIAEDAATFGLDAERFRDLAGSLAMVVWQEASAFHRHLMDTYTPFDPDRDTLPGNGDRAARTPDGYRRLYHCLEYLFAKANFECLDNVQVEGVIRTANTRGLRVRVRPELIEHLDLWVRGRSTSVLRRRTWRHPLRGVVKTMPAYPRLVVLAKLRHDPHVVVKLFREIPEQDVEALLPHAEVRMGLIDRAKLIGGTAGTVGTAVAKGFKLLTMLVLWSRLLWLVLIGCLIIAVRGALGYRSARRARDAQRTQHLYYQNLGNNASAIHTVLTMIKQEEHKEAVLGYAICHRDGARISSDEDLGRRAEAYLRSRFGADVTFDATDAIETLERLGLFRDRARYEVMPPQTASQHVDHHRRDARSIRYHADMIATRIRITEVAVDLASTQRVGDASGPITA